MGVPGGIDTGHDDFLAQLDQGLQRLEEPGSLRLAVLGEQIGRLCQGVGGYQHVSRAGDDGCKAFVVVRTEFLQVSVLGDQADIGAADHQEDQQVGVHEDAP